MKLRTSINRFFGRPEELQLSPEVSVSPAPLHVEFPQIDPPAAMPVVSNLMKLLTHFGVNSILDVGANSGQYATRMFESGFAGSVISFEPLTAAFAALRDAACHRTDWTAVNLALGNRNETTQINIANNSWSSSILPMLAAHLHSAPESGYVGQEQVQVRTLDSIFGQYCGPRDRVFLKIDTQGFEKHVLEGAKESLFKIVGIQLEMSLIPLYETELLMPEMLGYLDELGYQLYQLENGFTDQTTGRLLQVDGVFFRRR